MMKHAAAATLLLTSPATAGEIVGGVSAHGIDLGFVTRAYESGVDLRAGVRSGSVARVAGADVRVQVLGSVNLDGGTSFVAASALLRWRLGSRAYVQPGVGVAVHDGDGDDFQRTPDDLYLGSRVVLAPELAFGLRLGGRWAVEASFLHLSHARLAGRQNPGLDTIGLRAVYRFGD